VEALGLRCAYGRVKRGHHAQEKRLAAEIVEGHVAETVGAALVELEVWRAVTRVKLRARNGQGGAAHLHGTSGHDGLLSRGCFGWVRRPAPAAPAERAWIIVPPSLGGLQAGSPRRGPRRDRSRIVSKDASSSRARDAAAAAAAPTAGSGGPTCHSARYASSP